MTTATARASLDEVRDFANKVRKAGGGNPLHALVPAFPTDATKCLIAKNLNFNCIVSADDGNWYMGLDDEKIARKIAETLKLDLVFVDVPIWDTINLPWRISLPSGIGRVAEDFDKAYYLACDIDAQWKDWETSESNEEYHDNFHAWYEGERLPYIAEDWGYEGDRWRLETFSDVEALIQEMWPYIEQAQKEVLEIGTFNEKGELLL